MKKILFIAFWGALMVSCGAGTEPPENLIKEDKYIDLLIELQLLKSYQAISNIDSTTADSLLRAVFKKYGVTEKQFKKSHEYYQGRLEKQIERIDQAIDRLRKDRIHRPDTTAVDSLAADTTVNSQPLSQ